MLLSPLLFLKLLIKSRPGRPSGNTNESIVPIHPSLCLTHHNHWWLTSYIFSGHTAGSTALLMFDPSSRVKLLDALLIRASWSRRRTLLSLPTISGSPTYSLSSLFLPSCRTQHGRDSSRTIWLLRSSEEQTLDTTRLNTTGQHLVDLMDPLQQVWEEASSGDKSQDQRRLLRTSLTTEHAASMIATTRSSHSGRDSTWSPSSWACASPTGSSTTSSWTTAWRSSSMSPTMEGKRWNNFWINLKYFSNILFLI